MLRAVITFSYIFVGTLSCTLLAVTLWFIVRKKYRRVWLPLLSIFAVPSSRLPRLRLRWPPWLPFVCFLCAASAALLYALRPHSLHPMAETKRTLKLYLFIDFSPSLGAYATLAQYRTFLRDVYTRLRQLGRVTVGTSHRDSLQQFIHPQAFAEHLATLAFHREGLQLASVLRQQSARLGEMDRIIIVSDRDRYTWHNLHWQHLTASLHHLEVPQLRERSDVNLYLARLHVVPTPHRATSRLEVEVAAAGVREQPRPFTLAVYRGQQKITQTQASIAAEQRRVVLPLRLPRHKQAQAQTQSQSPAASQWRVHLQTEQADAVPLDDELYFNFTGSVPQVTIIADLHGERLLDDPLFQLQTTFEVLGFKIARRDRALPSATPSDLWVLAFGRNFTLPQHCPTRPPPKTRVWLLPQSPHAPQSTICRCYQLLRGRAPTDCNTLAEVLTQDGVRQDKNALFVQRANITVFRLPPYAQARTGGFKYAGVPVLIQQLLQQQGLLTTPQALQQQPRSADFFSLASTASSASLPANVPRGESLLQKIARADLPPAVRFDRQAEQLSLPRYRRDALPWVQALLALAILAALIETAGGLLRLRHTSHHRAQES